MRFILNKMDKRGALFDKEEITILAQLLTGIKDAVEKLESAENNGDKEDILAAKKEIRNFQKEIAKRL